MNKKNSKPKSLKSGLRSSREFIKYTNIAARMISIILVGVFGGLKLDEYLGFESPVFVLILSILAVFMAMYVIIREVSKK